MLEHQAEFANALRGGREMRERLFDHHGTMLRSRFWKWQGG